MKTIKTLEKFSESKYQRMLFEAIERIYDYDYNKLINDFHYFMYSHIKEAPEIIARLIIVIPIIYEIDKNFEILKGCVKMNQLSINPCLDNFVKSAIKIHENIDLIFDDFIFLQGNNRSNDTDCHWRVMQVINLIWWIDRNIDMLKSRYEEIEISERAQDAA